jgi:hypothetical protein
VVVAITFFIEGNTITVVRDAEKVRGLLNAYISPEKDLHTAVDLSKDDLINVRDELQSFLQFLENK